MKVMFIRNFDWTVPNTGGRVTRAYKAGHAYVISQVCFDAAALAGAVLEPIEAMEEATADAGTTRRR